MDETTLIFDPSRTTDQIINDLKRKTLCPPKWERLVLDYDPRQHRITNDHTERQDKFDREGNLVGRASRIYIGLEKLLTRRITEFMFAIPVRRVYHGTEGSDVRQQIARAIEAVYRYARIDAENIRRGTAYFAACEVLTLWYVVDKPNTLYGFPSRWKLKCKTYSPMDVVRLYPLIDEMGDMLAMSVEYTRRQPGGEEVTYFETYTSERHYKWRRAGAGWEAVGEPETIRLMKIPGAYLMRHEPVWHGLTRIRQELEYTLSRNSDVIAYNAAPVLKIAGRVTGEEQRGEVKRVYRVENGGDVSYVSWAQSIEATKYHVDTLLRLYWMQSQMPDVSFEQMKSLGNIGYDARQMLLTDAHLRVGDESGPWVEFFEREASVVKAFLSAMNRSWASEMDNVEVEHVITPFIQNDEDASADRLLKLNGGRPVMSQLESIRQAGYSQNADATLEQIRREEAADRQSRLGSLFDGGEHAL